ncbi:MAG: helix-turn-helix transcriptional regulator [Tomitella sp.]|nr:helix-turn-helix transcriptional regulator [Tomitella sp.]
MQRRELADFLRHRRALLRPEHVGLRSDPGRRTPGLRREEVAERAAISVDYYVRLEQARGPAPSGAVLESVAAALYLSAAEREHLFRLAEKVPQAPAAPLRSLSEHVTELVRRLPDAGVVVQDACYDVIGYNRLADALLGDLAGDPNLARRRFLGDGLAREPHGAAEFGAIAVARLRNAAARYPQDARLNELLTELRTDSDEFTRLWRTHPVHAPGHRSKTLAIPEVGDIRVNCDAISLPGDQQMVFITADQGSAAERAFRRLASAASGSR